MLRKKKKRLKVQENKDVRYQKNRLEELYVSMTMEIDKNYKNGAN